MTDDDFAKFMRQQSSSGHFAIVFVVCIIAVCLLAWSVAWADECIISCTGTAWRLELNGEALETDIPSEAECAALAAEIEPQTAPFSRLTCTEYPIARQES